MNTKRNKKRISYAKCFYYDSKDYLTKLQLQLNNLDELVEKKTNHLKIIILLDFIFSLECIAKAIYAAIGPIENNEKKDIEQIQHEFKKTFRHNIIEIFNAISKVDEKYWPNDDLKSLLNEMLIAAI